MPKGIRMNQERFLEIMKENFGDKLDFSNSVFVHSDKDIEYVCPKHGLRKTKARNLLAGYGCKLCARELVKEKLTWSQEKFLEEAEKVNKGRCDLSKVKYINNNTKIEVVCPEHGSYWVLPRTFLSGHRCPKCMKKYSDTEYFKECAEKVHKGKYDYTEVEYVRSNEPVKIRCKRCGNVFYQTPSTHLRGSGCECYAREAKSKAARHELIYGFGINDYEGYIIDENGEYLDSYNVWFQMIRRCYNEEEFYKHPTYIGCFVCEEWRYYSNFKKWFDDPENGYKKGYQLDKDIICKGNKEYCPEKCCFVPNELNSITTKANTLRGDTPIGVSKHGNKYRSAYSRLNKLVHMGMYDTPEEAFEVYKKAKEAWMKEYGEILYNEGKITERVKDALSRYIVEKDD